MKIERPHESLEKQRTKYQRAGSRKNSIPANACSKDAYSKFPNPVDIK